MIAGKYLPLVIRQITRHPARSTLTVGGVATAMYLFVAIQAMQQGVAAATHRSATDTTLVVYREDRFCPFTSRLPEYYVSRIGEIDGVASVVPMKIVVNNCRASLDVVTFRGVPRDRFVEQYAPNLEIIEGSIEQWKRRSDASLLGETLARRRGLKVGDRFDAAGVTTTVAGICRSDQPQDQNVAYVHLDFLQQTTDKHLGIVTQFNVQVEDPQRLDEVAVAIDRTFDHAEEPTATRAEKAFVAHVAGDMIELVSFTRYLGWGCVAAVLALIANAIVLSVQDRIKETAVLQTLGFTGPLVARLILTEGMIVGLIGGTVGAALAVATVWIGRFSLSVDGLSLPIEAGAGSFAVGLAIAAAIGVLASFVPAIQASRRQIASCFRAV